ncbi:MAG: hypothetical protein AVDCRST_MAG64-2404, partial [uncultured Phycisphaerae bacterium]
RDLAARPPHPTRRARQSPARGLQRVGKRRRARVPTRTRPHARGPGSLLGVQGDVAL